MANVTVPNAILAKSRQKPKKRKIFKGVMFVINSSLNNFKTNTLQPR